MSLVREDQGIPKHQVRNAPDTFDLLRLSKQGSTPTPWARGLRDQIQRRALQTQKILHAQGYSAQRGIETMVSDHGLGRGQTMG